MVRHYASLLAAFALLLSLCCVRAPAVGETDGSLFPNGTFETDKNTDNWPDDWGRPNTGGSWEVEDGNHFLRLASLRAGELVLLYRPVDLPADVRALALSWRQRVSDLRTGKEPWFDARIMLEFKDAAGQKLNQRPSPPYTNRNTEDWVERTTEFLVPENAVMLEFMPTLFQVERGTFDLDDLVLKPTDPAPLESAAKAAATEAQRAHVPPEAPQPAKWPQELHVIGAQVLNKDGKPVWLQGVNVVSLDWAVTGEHVLRSIVTALEDWKANLIRLPVNEEHWFGKGSGQKDGGAAYRELVDAAVNLAANRGAYLLLDLHRFQAPRQEHADFWEDAAARYKNHPAVLFDLFNEPHGTSGEVWRNGGLVSQKDGPGFQSVGMQGLVDAVRGTGARNVVVAGGLDWAYDLSGIANGFALDDRGGNGIICATHIYPWKSDWKGKVLIVADKHSVLLGEVGADVKRMDFIPAANQEDPYTWVPDVLGFIQKYKLHWTGFSFHPGATPVLITGWDYTPTPFWGAFAKRALAGEQFPLGKLR